MTPMTKKICKGWMLDGPRAPQAGPGSPVDLVGKVSLEQFVLRHDGHLITPHLPGGLAPELRIPQLLQQQRLQPTHPRQSVRHHAQESAEAAGDANKAPVNDVRRTRMSSSSNLQPGEDCGGLPCQDVSSCIGSGLICLHVQAMALPGGSIKQRVAETRGWPHAACMTRRGTGVGRSCGQSGSHDQPCPGYFIVQCLVERRVWGESGVLIRA